MTAALITGKLGSSLTLKEEGGCINCPQIVRKYADALGISEDEIRAVLSWLMDLSDGLAGNEVHRIARSQGFSERRATGIKFIYRCRHAAAFCQEFARFMTGTGCNSPSAYQSTSEIVLDL